MKDYKNQHQEEESSKHMSLFRIVLETLNNNLSKQASKTASSMGLWMDSHARIVSVDDWVIREISKKPPLMWKQKS